MNRLKEIAARMRELDTELSGLDVTTQEGEKRMAEIKTEVESLTQERSRILAAEKDAIQRGFNEGTDVEITNGGKGCAISSRSTLRSKLAFVLGRKVRGGKFTEVEERALGSALTTTAATYVAATANVDGVNNAGIFISTKVVLDLLKEEGKLSPIFRDITFTHIPGLVDFPYRKSRTKAKAKAEGKAGTDNQWEWDKISGKKGYLQTIIRVTDEVLALSEFDLGSYIVEQLLIDMEEDWGTDLIYGSGTDDHVAGITLNATPAVSGGYDTAAAGFDYVKLIVDTIKLSKGKYRKGAKLYLSQSVYDEIAFSVDANGNFKHPVFNNATGINNMGPIKVEVDENLNEGDFLLGNVSKYYKANCLIDMRLETERVARSAITDYIASEFCAAVPVPGAFIYGTKKI